MLIRFFLLICILDIYLSQQTDNYQRVAQSCLILSQHKLKCLLPSFSKNCCQNCSDLQINCKGVTRYKQVFFLAKFIDCPIGVTLCQIVNIDEILKSEWVKYFFQNEQDNDRLTNLIQFQALECQQDYILLGGMCIQRQNCLNVKLSKEIISCIKCQEGYYLNENLQCVKCEGFTYLNSLKSEIGQNNQLCQNCYQNNICKQCIDGYNIYYDQHFQKNICVQCQNYCKCNSTQSCIECTHSYYYKRKYFINKDKQTPLYEVCESCIPFVESLLGPNLVKAMEKYQLKTEDIISSCEGLQLDKITMKNLSIKDVVDQTFILNIYQVNGQFETCSEGCAKCVLNEQKQETQCQLCLNGYYQDIKQKNICLSCQEKDLEFQLCDNIYYQQFLVFQTTQCKTYFNQPSLGKQDQYFECTIQPTCIIAEKWTHENKISKGSCKKCFQGYKKVKMDPNYNYYQCVKQVSNYKNLKLQDKCQQGYFFDDVTNICMICPQNCILCNIKGCIQCDKTKAYSNILSNGYFECIIISENTSDVTNCSIFGEGNFYELQQQRPIGGYCLQCKRGYQAVYKIVTVLSIIDKCQPIIKNCLSYDNINFFDEYDLKQRHDLVCSLCEFGYFIDNNVCKQIPENCALFDTYLKKCQNCKYGYKLFNDECIQCTNITSLSQVGYFKCLTIIEEIELTNT